MGLVDWGEVFEAFDAVGLEASFVLVEAAAADASSAAGLGDVSDGLGEFEDAEALFEEFLFRGGHLRHLLPLAARLELCSGCLCAVPGTGRRLRSVPTALYTAFLSSRKKANCTD